MVVDMSLFYYFTIFLINFELISYISLVFGCWLSIFTIRKKQVIQETFIQYRGQ